MAVFTPPSPDCPLCPRLVAFRSENRQLHPQFHNAPVPSFGNMNARLLVAGLAPGLKGANFTGRPFTGDYAGIILYEALAKHGFAQGEYTPEKLAMGESDGFTLINCRITNAVRCVPPANKPEPSEIKHCNCFLMNEINTMPELRVIISLGHVSHKAVIAALGFKQSAYAFGHAHVHNLPRTTGNLQLINSYHTSRYNINTGTLTVEMFDKIIEKAKSLLL